MAWFDEDAARLQRELTALEAAGLEHVVDEDLRREQHVLRLRVAGTIAGDTNAWTCDFPDGYPYFPPFVTGENRGYRHHHNPTTGQHCLLREGEGHWKPSMALADLLLEQWPKFLAAQDADASPEAPAALEVQQAEPWSRYLRYTNEREALLWDSALEPPVTETAGFVQVLPLGRYQNLKWLAIAVTDVAGTPLASRDLNNTARDVYQVGQDQMLPWVRLDAAPEGTEPEVWWRAAAEAWGAAKPKELRPGRKGTGPAKRLLVAFPEEVAHRQLGWGWAIVCDRGMDRSRKPILPRFERVVRTGASDLARRAPQLAGMRTKRILVAGLGGLGSQIVRLLAPTCPAGLLLWDRDTVEADTAIRWAGALAADGLPKATVLAGEVLDTQTHTAVDVIVAPVGVSRGPLAGRTAALPNVHDEFVRHLDSLDLVIDATADKAVQHYLSDQAREHQIAYLRADAQYGVWAGMVALQRPHAEVCWMCWAHHSVDKTLPLLPRDATGGIQPPGCGEPTYRGTGFDLAAIAVEAVRMGTSYLTAGDSDGHPFDVMTLRLRDDSGRLIAPKWDGHDLKRHPTCPNHA